MQQEHEHCATREAERREAGDNVSEEGDQDNVNDPDDDKEDDITEKRRKYFNQRSKYTPETRVEMQKVVFHHVVYWGTFHVFGTKICARCCVIILTGHGGN